MAPTWSALLIVIGLVAWPHDAWSQQSQQRFVRVEGGLTGVHDEVMPSAGLHVLLPLNQRQSARLDVGGFGDRHAFYLDAGLSVRAPTNSTFALILRGGGGILFEAEWRGPYARGGTGFEWRLSPTLAITATLETGVHDGLSGPHRFLIGIVRPLNAGSYSSFEF